MSTLAASADAAKLRRLHNELDAAERSLDMARNAGDKAWIARADVRVAACKLDLQRARTGTK